MWRCASRSCWLVAGRSRTRHKRVEPKSNYRLLLYTPPSERRGDMPSQIDKRSLLAAKRETSKMWTDEEQKMEDRRLIPDYVRMARQRRKTVAKQLQNVLIHILLVAFFGSCLVFLAHRLPASYEETGDGVPRGLRAFNGTIEQHQPNTTSLASRRMSDRIPS